ncbi:unnamed protein product [Rotaria magnacalcarata]|uniref:Coiled-coil domain-containing protein 61-like n=3 Tax=Rotaria magnacalcarata TaxID=392030 RepID=A0A816NB21_9BILA|nr:unnamed protein product [Rotaria magnacalcarata]
MIDSTEISLMSQNPLSSLKHYCINEIYIRNHPYIISMCIQNSEQIQLEILVQPKESVDQWKSSFNVHDIEKMTEKTGNFKSFNVFVDMLEDAINQRNSSVSIDLFTTDDLEFIRKKQEDQKKTSTTKLSNKRYLILIYNVEYDRIYYPLSLRYCGRSDTLVLIEQIRQLTAENELLKSRLDSCTKDLNDSQEEYSNLRKGNDNYYQQFSLYDGKEKNLQVEYLRQMIRANEYALIKERINLQKTKAKTYDHYKKLNNQIEFLKTSERQLKLKMKNLTNEISLLKKNASPCSYRPRSSPSDCPKSTDQHRYRSKSGLKRLPLPTNSRTRFNPTAYIHEKNLKLRHVELQKTRETHQRLNIDQQHSESDFSDSSLKANNNDCVKLKSRKKSSRKRTKELNQQKFESSIDSDIERISSSVVLRKVTSNNSTKVFLPENIHRDQINLNSNLQNFNDSDNMVDIDKRLRSLEKFIKHTLLIH